ncbi:hypothetical protein [Cupriavidus necator]
MKPVVHHFHSHPPHHGAKYYLAFAGAMLVIAAAYVMITHIRHVV